MIPTTVWEDWTSIFRMVINMLMGNVITAFCFAGVAVKIITNLIYRIASSKGENT